MEIYAKCKFDYESIRALTYASMYRRVKPKTAFVTMMILGSITLGLEVYNGICWGVEYISIISLILAILLVGLSLFMYWGFPKLQYKALGKMKNVENEYIFCDEIIKVSSKSEEYNGEGELKYSMIPKVTETSKYLLIYQSKNQAFLIEKATITNGTIDDIREKLTQYVKKKYIVCRF